MDLPYLVAFTTPRFSNALMAYPDVRIEKKAETVVVIVAVGDVEAVRTGGGVAVFEHS